MPWWWVTSAGGEEPGLSEVAVAYRVDATVDRVEAAGPGPVGDVVPGQPEAPKLAGGGDPVLPAGQLATARSGGVRRSWELFRGRSNTLGGCRGWRYMTGVGSSVMRVR